MDSACLCVGWVARTWLVFAGKAMGLGKGALKDRAVAGPEVKSRRLSSKNSLA